MTSTIENYDRSITAQPRQLVDAESVEHIQSILRNTRDFPSPVRAMGRCHSMTACACSDGTIINMSRMNRIVEIDRKNMTMTVEPGVLMIDASNALRSQGMQFITNIEIGDASLGAMACCHTKDGLDRGQICSSVTGIKWVMPSGALAEASETQNPDLLRLVRSSHGLCGVIYEVTFRIKPLEAIQFTYLPRPVAEVTHKEVADIVARSDGIMCWMIGNTLIFQFRSRAAKAGRLGSLLPNIRRRLWTRTGAHLGRLIDLYVPTSPLKSFGHYLCFASYRMVFAALRAVGGFSLNNPEKIVDYRHTPPSSRFSFTFWAFPVDQWLDTLREYRKFADQHFAKYGFRCNCPLVCYYVPKDDSSILSFTRDGDVLTIDPIHAYSDLPAWERYLREFNEFACQRKGIPLLNQTPLVERTHLIAAYGDRWREFSAWVKTVDPERRMVNAFFAELLA
jgi:hypothetical protein